MPIFKKVNKNFFKIWTPEMAYILGFFAADGYITIPKRGGGFWCIDVKDKKIVEKIKREIKSSHAISIRKRFQGKYITYRLQIGSIEMCDDLRRIGFDKNKTKSLAVPNVPLKYFSSFTRGYFDGDGNVWSGLIHKGRKTQTITIQTVFTSCSLSFLEGLKNNLEIFGIDRGRIRQGKGDYSRLTYSVNNSLKLYDFMYNSHIKGSGGLFLNRKKRIFEKFKKLRS